MSEKVALKELLNDYCLSVACTMVEPEAFRTEGEPVLAALVESYMTIGNEIKRILNASAD